MCELRGITSTDIVTNISALDRILPYYNVYGKNSEFFYNNNTVYEDVYSVDIKSFNIQFLKYINRFICSDNINNYINYLLNLDKSKRVVEFGCLFREVSKLGIPLNKYLVATRNIFFSPFFKYLKLSPRSLTLYRLNYDDVEFSLITTDVTSDLFIHKNFISSAKLNKYSHIIVLNKRDGVYYINDGAIIDIKYTSGWVNIPAYKFLIKLVINFILNKDISIEQLNQSMVEYIELANNSDFFGYDDDPLSKSYSPNDIIPMSAKYLFIANVMSKFSILFK